MKKSPFKNFVVTIGNLPTAYLESMSYYEAVTYLTNYIANNLAPAERANAEAILELQNYFDNLDVQEEINNKLDEMADDGTLAEIINVEMIGNLSNLTTVNKTNIVSAINEVDGLIELINLTEYTNYEPSLGNMTINNGNYVGGKITIAKNPNGSLAKIYGVLIVENVQANAEVSVTLLNTGISVDTQFKIYPSGSTFQYTSTNSNHLVENSITVLTDGTMVIGNVANVFEEQVRERIILYPCLYYMKDFGDSGQ